MISFKSVDKEIGFEYLSVVDGVSFDSGSAIVVELYLRQYRSARVGTVPI